jgi:hypothetical protein
MRRAPLLSLVFISGCLTPVAPPYQPVYHNPLDVLDAGVPDAGDAGVSDGGGPSGTTYSQGVIDGHSLDLTSAIVWVQSDAGSPSASIWLADVPDLCGALEDGGLSLPWNLLTLHFAGDSSGDYTVASILPPGGATARFDWQSPGDAFGFELATSGSILLQAIDAANQTASGDYQLDFGDAGAVTGHFEAGSCPVHPSTP